MIEVFDLGSMEDKGFVEQKRRLKTPSQVEALENIYAEHKYPTESMKAKLSRELGLSEKQVQRWFRHRRLKDKKGKKEEPDSNEELDAGSGSNLQQQQHVVRTELGRSEKKRLLGISDYPSAVLAAELTDHDMLKRNQRVMEEDPHHAGTVSTSQDTSSLQSKSSYEMDALRNGNYVEMKGSNSKKSKGQVMHMGMEHTYTPQHFAVATEDQYIAKGLKQAGGSNSKQAKNWDRFKAKDGENHRFVNNHDYPSAVLAAELTDRELLKGNHDIVEDPYVSLSQERSSLQSGSSYEMEARRLPSKSLNSFEIEGRSKRREKAGLHMVVEPIYWQQAVEHQAISAVKAQLGRLFREDGPMLGVEFDPLPPDAFGYRFSFSTLFFSHKENTKSTLARAVLIIWLFLVLIISQSYTANLTTILTLQRLSTKIQGINSLVVSNSPVGYQTGSYVKNYLSETFNIANSRLVPLYSVQSYAEALSLGPNKGGVAAVVDELPYIQLFLSKYCGFTIVGGQFSQGGWVFVFPKNSPLAPDMSTAILALSESGKLQSISNKWWKHDACDKQNSQVNSNKLDLNRFWGLFLLLGIVCVISLLVFFCRMTYLFIRDAGRYIIEDSNNGSRSSFISRSARILKAFCSFVLRDDDPERNAELQKKPSEQKMDVHSGDCSAFTGPYNIREFWVYMRLIIIIGYIFWSNNRQVHSL